MIKVILLFLVTLKLNLCQTYVLFSFHADENCTLPRLEKSVLLPVNVHLSPITDTYLFIIDWFDKHQRNFLNRIFPDSYWDTEESIRFQIYQNKSIYWEECDYDTESCLPLLTTMMDLNVCTQESLNEQVYLKIELIDKKEFINVYDFASLQYGFNYFIKTYSNTGDCQGMGENEIYFIQRTFDCFEKHQNLTENYYKKSEAVYAYKNQIFLVDYGDNKCMEFNAVELSIIRGNITCEYGTKLEIFGYQIPNENFPLYIFPLEDHSFFIFRSYVDGGFYGNCLSNEAMENVEEDYVKIESMYKIKMDYCYQRDEDHFRLWCDQTRGCKDLNIFYYSLGNVNCDPHIDEWLDVTRIIELEKCFYDPGHEPYKNTWNIFYIDCEGNYNMFDSCVTCIQGYFGNNCESYNCFERMNNQSDVCYGNGECFQPDLCLCTNLMYKGDDCGEFDYEILGALIIMIGMPCVVTIFLLILIAIVSYTYFKSDRKRRNVMNNFSVMNYQQNVLNQTSAIQSTNQIELVTTTPTNFNNDLERNIQEEEEEEEEEDHLEVPKKILLGVNSKKYRFYDDHFYSSKKKVMFENIEKIDRLMVDNHGEKVVKFILFLSFGDQLTCLFPKKIASFFQKYVVEGIDNLPISEEELEEDDEEEEKDHVDKNKDENDLE